ncbi:MLP-like protein 43 [Bienertia sinuspersici]
MSLKRKLEGEVEIRASATDVVHDIYKSKPHHISQVASHILQGVDVHEGDCGNIDSRLVWRYTIEGKSFVAKTVLEEIDEERKILKYRIIEGDIMNDYKNFTATCEVVPKDGETCIAKWTFEYEKMNAGIPEPSALLDASLEVLKHIDDHHHGINK